MKNLRINMIFGAIFVSLLGTLFHFVYEWTANNAIVGLFVPVNESTWEHMKLIFFPMLLFSFYANKKLSKDYPCISSALSFGTILGTILIPVLFYTYSGGLGYNISVLDISTFYISVIVAFILSYKLTLSCKINKYGNLLNFILIIFTVAFIIFTVFPPEINLFVSP